MGLRKMAKNLIPGHGAPSNDSNPGFHVFSLDSLSYDKGERRRIWKWNSMHSTFGSTCKFLVSFSGYCYSQGVSSTHTMLHRVDSELMPDGEQTRKTRCIPVQSQSAKCVPWNSEYIMDRDANLLYIKIYYHKAVTLQILHWRDMEIIFPLFHYIFTILKTTEITN